MEINEETDKEDFQNCVFKRISCCGLSGFVPKEKEAVLLTNIEKDIRTHCKKNCKLNNLQVLQRWILSAIEVEFTDGFLIRKQVLYAQNIELIAKNWKLNNLQVLQRWILSTI